MREINASDISKAVAEACVKANIVLTDDLKAAFDKGLENEKSAVGREFFCRMKENYETAERENIPVCQDTGMAVIFCELGQDVHIVGGDFEKSINDGVAEGYINGYLRLSVVGDPLRRVNTGSNTPAVIYTSVVPGENLKITVAPKGFGSENMSSLKMFEPSASRDDIIDYIADTVKKAGSCPCPPVVVGVGLGGTADRAALLAKKALTRRIGEKNPDRFYNDMENETLKRINSLGIGPQGLGGAVTALAVHIEPFATHIAGLPCAVNIGCHVNRHAEIIL